MSIEAIKGMFLKRIGDLNAQIYNGLRSRNNKLKSDNI